MTEDNIPNQNFGARVKAQNGATGRYVGRGLVLFISAQDNDLAYDRLDPYTQPWTEAPLPTDRECSAFNLGLSAVPL